MPIQSSGSTEAKIMLVGEFPHEQDLLRGLPFIGGSGYELTKMLREAGIYREHCFITMICKDRVPQGRVEGCVATKKKDITPAHVLFNGKWVLPMVANGMVQLKADIERVKPNVIVTFGNLALWAVTGQWGAGNWRSSVMESILVDGQKVIPTLSPAMVLHQWNLRPLIVHDLKRALRESHNGGITPSKYKFVLRGDYPTTENCLQTLLTKAQSALANGDRLRLGVDIETRAGHISCIAIAWSDADAICIPLMSVADPEGYWTPEQEADLVFLMYQLFRLVTVIGQNWNYDAQYIFRHWHFLCPSVEDTMIQQHSCFSNLEKNLAFLSSMYCDDHLYWKDDRTNWTEGPKGEGEIAYWRYNCTDAVRTLTINKVLKGVVTALGLDDVNNFQQALAPIVLDTMNRGIRVDHQARAQLSIDIQEHVAIRESWLQEVTGQELNIRSPKQMQDFFYGDMGLKPILNKKTKTPTTDDEALHRIAEKEPILKPITRKIAELRSLGVFHSTFVQAGLDTDGRMRTSFNVAGTDTYRFSSRQNAFGTGLNVQNIPKGGETEDNGLELPNVRKLFIPDPGHTFFDIDLDSADLRIVTWESDCKWMKDNFTAGRKPYVEVMREYYQNPAMTKHSHPREYAMFKSLCHGSNYLGTAQGIAPRIGLDVKETERVQQWYFELCPEIRKWQEDIKQQVTKQRFIRNPFGYKFHFFDRIEGTIFNQAVAWIPQSTVACLINRAYVNIHHNLKEVEILLQVHDSLAGQFQTHHGDWALRRIVEESQIVIPYPDPLIIPVGIVSSTKSWGECG